jgi:predicted RNase H-like HicB family nuclease
MKYKVNLEKTEEGYSISVPYLPGCWSQGKTELEALENIKDAIHSYLVAERKGSFSVISNEVRNLKGLTTLRQQISPFGRNDKNWGFRSATI